MTSPAPITLRSLQVGDIGWIIRAQALMYAREYGWNIEFEALVAQIAGDFVAHHRPEHERAWVAEQGGHIVGSVFLVKQSETEAKLRLLYVDASARGHGLGRKLTQECIQFARQCGYKTLTLWTNSVLLAARGIYAAEGFTLINSEPHRSFGHDLIGEHWSLTL